MPKRDRDLVAYADDILNAIDMIDGFVEGRDFESFAQDSMAFEATRMKLQDISEASRYLPEELTAQEKEVEWKGIKGFGNISRHGYDSICSEPVWDAVQSLSVLKSAVERIKENLLERKREHIDSLSQVRERREQHQREVQESLAYKKAARDRDENSELSKSDKSGGLSR